MSNQVTLTSTGALSFSQASQPPTLRYGKPGDQLTLDAAGQPSWAQGDTVNIAEIEADLGEQVTATALVQTNLTSEASTARTAEGTLTTNVAANATAITSEASTARTAEGTLTTNVATNATAITALQALHSRALKQDLAATLPSATNSVLGTATPVVLATDMAGLSLVAGFSLVYAAVGVETVSTVVTATFSDTTTGTFTDTSVISGTNVATAAQIAALHKDGTYITALSFAVSSSIDASTATVTPSLITGIQTP